MAGISAITVQREIILEAIRSTTQGEWKVLVVDDGSKRLVDGVVGEDDILEAMVTSAPDGIGISQPKAKSGADIERIEDRRPMNPEMDVLYLLSPQPHIIDCLMADFERRRYRKSYLIWTSALPSNLRASLDQSALARELIVRNRALNIDFFPHESHLITFRDPWSFPTLFHPACNPLVQKHMYDLAQKIVSVCVSLGEYPSIRYYSPRHPEHEAGVLCSHLARFVQTELDLYAKMHEDFPPLSTRPRGALIITDRSMDLFAPLVHELTYQAMVHDLLPLIEGDRLFYKTTAISDDGSESGKNAEISEKDSIWVANRHLHMKDLIDKLVGDFEKFRAKNPQFEASDDQPSSLNNIKDMLAGLPQFQEGKEAYSLHLGMAQDAVNVFTKRRLPDIASVEQSLATGLDEDNKKPKNLADQVVRLLDDDGITFPDRLRLIIEYLLYRDGLLASDIKKLLAHAQLPAQDGEVIHNLELLGAHVVRELKDTRPVAQPFFARKQPPQPIDEEGSLSRFEPNLKALLEELIRGSLDQGRFPFTKPHLDAAEGLIGQENVSQASLASLRSAKPTWARTRSSAAEPKQRIIVFMAGGATYSESRACYEISDALSKDVFLTTSHMLTPSLFIHQVKDLSVDKRRLNLPADKPKPKAPAHLFEKEPPPTLATPPSQQPPVAGMADMNLKSNGVVAGKSANGSNKNSSSTITSQVAKKDKEKDSEKKKKKHFFSSKK
ncbi:vacuolar sorting protein VPS33/slp1 [Pseudocyphellaria aurata]|nr:vacuolar sorting protein VPS33/slp1 [Pseudocyphellaria aurata]